MQEIFLLDLCFLFSGNINILVAEQEKHYNAMATSTGQRLTGLSSSHFSTELLFIVVLVGGSIKGPISPQWWSEG